MTQPESTPLLLRHFVCFNFYRGWRGISEFYRPWLPPGVSPQQSYVLELCDESRGKTVGSIASGLEIDPPAVSSLIGRMERSGLVRRELDPGNRRYTLVFISPAGVELRARVRESMARADNQLRKHFTEQDLQQLVRLVDKIQAAADEREAR
ncbi:MAG: MarR family winged helix-turn-helix transcriptional regulator [Aquisalimonadaceae bacterium]